MLDDLKRWQEIRNDDAFYGEGLGVGATLAILASLCILGWLLDRAEARRAPPAAVKVEAPALSHPLCFGREQELKQWGGGPVVNACVNADGTRGRQP